ncbi:DNA-binding response regulator [Pedobacter yonginense]|uniref:DNA-binding response regulator n=1 Tax=Pedobacter yonginense TaxID=651869 RepID=A0A317EIG1_9SPHI|nr:response regulator transcription factor [Pedobacter yonginense]PWS26135.1 DNA-binding response regulator [Pedobacter yonginense]
MNTYNCIIIEDEPLAAEILKEYIADVPFLKLIAVYENAIEALVAIQNDDIDVMFLDINLPKLKGMDFVKTLTHPPRVIITTAYHEYALEGYALNVVDYLLKPIEFNRFLQAVNKLKIYQGILPEDGSFTALEQEYIFVNVAKKKIKIYLADILYIESLKEYVKIFTQESSWTTKLQLGQIEAQIPKHLFLRIHRSFIVAKAKIGAYSSTEVEINGKKIPIGRSYKNIIIKDL